VKVVLHSACWPTLQYCYYLFNAETVNIQLQDYYTRRSYRNRYTIGAANGALDLTVPIQRLSGKEPTASIRICYKEKWMHQHQRSIASAYGKSPYFDFFGEEVLSLFHQQYDYLHEFNTAQLNIIFKLFRKQVPIHYPLSYSEPPMDWVDARFIQPSKLFTEDDRVKHVLQQPYFQCFDFRFGFRPNLSILDLLFHEGLHAWTYLKDTSEQVK